jgi:F420-dependent oxidoreductase-like protein
MLEKAIMIEGQHGLTWERWKRIVRFVEDAGFVGLYRSDHFTNANQPDLDSLELWTSLTWLADHTKRIEFGPLVSPFSFRHPAHIARAASAIDDLSGGRLILGLGAGWQEREHQLFGFDLLDVRSRLDRFDEGMEVTTRLLQSDDPVTFEGTYFQIREATLLPRPQKKGGPRILVGGNGKKRTLKNVVRYAQEWNGNFLTPEAFSERNMILDEMLAAAGREPESVRRSLMTGCLFGKDEAALNEKVAAFDAKLEDIQRHGFIAGNADAVNEQLGRLEEAGVQRLMLQWLDLDDLEGLEALAKAVL